MKNNEHYKTTAHRANEIARFYSHLAVFVMINLTLAGINRIITPSIPWFLFPLIGWGVVLIVHGLMIFVIGGKHLKKKLPAVELRQLNRR